MAWIIGSGGGGGGGGELKSKVIVSRPEQLSGTLDSSKEYFLDGIVDFTGTGLNIEIPADGLSLRGYNFDLSGIKCDDDNYTLFTSPVGGSGNVLGADYFIEVSGANSKAYNITSLTGFEAFEFSRVNYNNCTSLGLIDSYRQGLEDGTGRFGGSPTLELVGYWAGGFRITTSIVRVLSQGMVDPLFKAGTGFVMQSRFLSDINVDLPASASLLDFAPSNFPNPSTLQLSGCIVSRNGAINTSDSNTTPNVGASDLCSAWKGNVGLVNTFEGGSVGVTTELATLNSTVAVGEFLDVAASLWTVKDLQHFDNPAGGQLRNLGNSPREYKVLSSVVADSAANDVVSLRVAKWNNSLSQFESVLTQTRQINALVGSRDVGFFEININVILDQNDYVKLQIANLTAQRDITVESDSYMIVEER